MKTEILLDCPVCESDVRIDINVHSSLRVCSVICRDCYDGAPDAGPQLEGTGVGGDYRAKAIANWNESVRVEESERANEEAEHTYDLIRNR